MKVDKRIAGIITEYKNVRRREDETYKTYMSIYNDWEKMAFAGNFYEIANTEEFLELKAQLEISYKAYEDAKNEMRFYSKYALDALIEEFDL